MFPPFGQNSGNATVASFSSVGSDGVSFINSVKREIAPREVSRLTQCLTRLAKTGLTCIATSNARPHLQATLERLDEIESLQRTRELTLKDLSSSSAYRVVVKNGETPPDSAVSLELAVL